MKITPVILDGARVTIKPLEMDHIQELFVASNNPDIWTYMPLQVHSVDDMADLVKSKLREKDE